MKKLFISFVLLFITGVYANAQSSPANMPTAKEMAIRTSGELSSKLKLNAAQKTKVTAILTDYNEKMYKYYTMSKNNQQVSPAIYKQLNSDTEVKINAVLNAAQRKELAKLKGGKEKQ
ncbi:hypothetical protein ACSBL2_09770 [Pedobacter sp. AW31-3R]|uniref:hypothetical protein n=1 Tax=Pedobacter sp. AW31-3R TaxID=3445781 RepID=UPI003F9EE736